MKKKLCARHIGNGLDTSFCEFRHEPEPITELPKVTVEADGIIVTVSNGDQVLSIMPKYKAHIISIVQAINSHEELLRIAKRYKLSLGFGNVDERAEIEKAISKAEGK